MSLQGLYGDLPHCRDPGDRPLTRRPRPAALTAGASPLSFSALHARWLTFGFPAPLLLAALLSGAVCDEAAAQTQPLQAEEATTAPGGTLAVESALELIRGEPSFLTGQPRNRWDGPRLRAVYSPFDCVELDLEWTSQVTVVGDPGFGTHTDAGDVVLRTKLRLLGPAEGRPALAARYEISLPNTSSEHGLGPDALRMSAQLLLSGQVGPTTVHVNAGLAIQDRPLSPHSQSDFFDYALALEHPLTGRLTVLGEIAGLAGDGSPGADVHAEARLGVRLDRGSIRWDAALRRGLSDADGGWGFTIGFAWRRTPAVEPPPPVPGPWVSRPTPDPEPRG